MMTTINSILAEMNQAIENKNVSAIPALKVSMDNELVIVNATIKANLFTDILATENPAFEVCKVGFVMLKKLTIKEEKYEIGEKMEVIDFFELSDISLKSETPKNVYKNHQYLFFIEAFNHAVFGYMTNVMGIKTKSKKLEGFKESATASSLGISTKDMRTTKGLVSALQKVSDSIVEGIKITEVEAQTLMFNYSKWSNSTVNGVCLTNGANFRRMIMRVMHKIATGSEFIGE